MAYYQEAINIINYIIYAVNFMTILGSLLSFIVFSRKAFEKSSVGIYCKSLAIFDLFVAFNLCVNIVSMIINIPLAYSNDAICKANSFITTGVSAVPAWILVAFSFDQLIIVSRIERFQFLKRKWFQYSIIFVIFIFHCALYSPIIVLASTNNSTHQNETIYSCDSNSNTLPIFYLIESSVMPFLFLIISVSFIVRILIKSRQKVSTVQGSALVARRRRHDFKFAFNSIILNILFIVLSAPVVLNFIINNQSDYWLFNFINTICNLFFYLNYALHFWIHLTFNSIFRNEFLVLFRIKRNH